MTITFGDFERVDIRVGKVVEVADFPEAHKPAFKLSIDFGEEIGLRKAVGAKYSDIMTQFLVESVLITGVGGVVGTIVGIFIAWGISLGALAAGYTWNFAVPIEAFITALLFSIVFGVIFGLYPAREAARMNPIEALKYNE